MGYFKLKRLTTADTALIYRVVDKLIGPATTTVTASSKAVGTSGDDNDDDGKRVFYLSTLYHRTYITWYIKPQQLLPMNIHRDRGHPAQRRRD